MHGLTSAHIFYSAGRLYALFEAYPELEALAENPVTAQGLIGPDRDRPTREQPRSAKQKGTHSDPMHWADVVADLELGVSQLTSGGLGVEAMRAQMQGLELDDFAHRKGRPLDEVETVWHAAIGKLARRLEPLSTASGAA